MPSALVLTDVTLAGRRVGVRGGQRSGHDLAVAELDPLHLAVSATSEHRQQDAQRVSVRDDDDLLVG